jgi:predicted HicB family RNase H-like nuclease
MRKYKRYNYSYLINPLIDDEGVGYEAIIPKFPKIHVFADTLEELDEMVMITIEEDIKTRKKRDFEIPKEDYNGSKNKEKSSGKIPLRIKPELHEYAKVFAQASQMSLNKMIERAIEKFVGFSGPT